MDGDVAKGTHDRCLIRRDIEDQLQSFPFENAAQLIVKLLSATAYWPSRQMDLPI